jgi:peptide deformylase
MKKIEIIINPTIEASLEKETSEEECLSFIKVLYPIPIIEMYIHAEVEEHRHEVLQHTWAEV